MKEFNKMADDVDRLQKEIEEIEAGLFFAYVSISSLAIWIPIAVITSFNPWVLKWVFAVEERVWLVFGWWGISLFGILQAVDKWLRQ